VPDFGVTSLPAVFKDGNLINLVELQKLVPIKETLDQKLQRLTTKSIIVLFMKGSPDEP